MADYNGAIQLEGVDNLLKEFRKAGVEVPRAAWDAVKAEGMRLIGTAQNNLRQNGSVVTGLLRASGHVAETRDGLDVGFFEKSANANGYAAYVEYGRRAGKMPPPDALEEYAYKKLHLRDRKTARAIGWAMAVSIARKGTRPHPFFLPAVELHKPRIVKAISDAVRKVTR